MKILIFIPHMGQGGVERSFINLSKELIKKGHNVKFVCLNKIVSAYKEELSEIKLNSRRTLFSIIKLSKVIEYEAPDILISAQYYANIAAIISNKISKNKTKIIISERNHLTSALTKYSLLKRRLIKFLIKLTYKRADLIFGNSESVCEDLKEKFVFKNNIKVKKILNPAFIEIVLKQSEEKVYDKWITDSDVPILVYVGRLEAQKDIDTLLKGFELINKTHKSKLLIIGSGSEREKLGHSPLNKKNLIKQIEFDENPYKYLKHCNVFLLTSIYEGMPNVLIEAQILGIPIVATDSPGGTSEALLNGKAGLLANMKDAKDISKKVNILLNNKEVVSNLSLNFEKSLERFNPKKISDQIILEATNLVKIK
jgi:glycosyltransferase involved in cell wall biosynthesis